MDFREARKTSGGGLVCFQCSAPNSIHTQPAQKSTAVPLPNKIKSRQKNISDRMATRGEKSKRVEDEAPEASPRRGPTLSTSTSSFEALDPHDPQLNQLASVMFSSTSDWISG